MFYTYILYSLKFNRTYVGQTNNLSNRLEYHNSGKVKSTKAYKPWKLIYSENFDSRAESMKREKWLKSPNGRKFIHNLLMQLSETNGLSVPSQ